MRFATNYEALHCTSHCIYPPRNWRIQIHQTLHLHIYLYTYICCTETSCVEQRTRTRTIRLAMRQGAHKYSFRTCSKRPSLAFAQQLLSLPRCRYAPYAQPPKATTQLRSVLFSYGETIVQLSRNLYTMLLNVCQHTLVEWLTGWHIRAHWRGAFARA